ncbi:WG repeat-containing protein [Clostridium ganghwense]|uniref:WG repeat-containing protein n=1 Tax=Clostridium ganghwense TaxID=312089 RepID=A0ABT4CUS0_9CLOT|nr:WG repeat-containing protein [Clostridium ganghwense]MCY6371699.1 WG repeat-containing protein [Clostridium ganghwense]
MWCGTENLYTASVKNIDGVKWGYINNIGEFIIKPKYDYANSFQDNYLAIVEFKNRYGIIDESGKYVVHPKYDTINQFSEGRAVIVDKGGFKLIDESGKEITTKQYNFIGTFQEERALYSITDSQGKWLYGYLDRQGNKVIPAKYENVSDSKEGKAIVKVREGEYQLIGLNGEVLNTYKYAYVGNRGEGLLAFKENIDGKYGFINEDGNVVIQPKYTSTQPFSGGRTVVNIAEDYGNSYGVIDKKGDFIIKPKYNDIQLLGENRVAVGIPIDKKKPFRGSKYAIADTDGMFLTNYIYYGISNYKDGLASAYDNKYTFFY